MSPSESTCHRPEALLELLQGKLSDDDSANVIRHLDGCKSCRDLLEETAAAPDSWTEAGELLAEDSWRDSASSSTDIVDASRSVQIKHALDMLQPTDDPDMLGRLGGYEVSGVIGSGSMGVVLKAADRSLDRTVAIKVLAPHLASSGPARSRFEREAKAAAAVIHPNVIAIHAVATDAPLPYLVMPYNRGMTLQRRVELEGPLPVVDVLRIGVQVASGLAAAHRQGLVHRDIKPGNILLEDGVERVAITDFGLARAVDDASMTRTGVIAGTPQYMSPEQALGEAVDFRTDLFSLGSLLYTLCTGRPPFRADTSFGTLRQITDKQPRPIREINPDIPPWLCQLISRLHAKSPEERYQSAEQTGELLEQCLAHAQTPGLPLPDELQPTTKRLSRDQRWYFVTALCVTAVVAAAFVFRGNGTSEREDTRGAVESSAHEGESKAGSIPSEILAPDESVLQWDLSPDVSPEEINRRVFDLAQEVDRDFWDEAPSPTSDNQTFQLPTVDTNE